MLLTIFESKNAHPQFWCCRRHFVNAERSVTHLESGSGARIQGHTDTIFIPDAQLPLRHEVHAVAIVPLHDDLTVRHEHNAFEIDCEV